MIAPRAVSRRRGLARIASLLVAAAVLAGCAATTARGPAGARPRSGYDARIDPLTAVDAAALAGRRIALDPGHGGAFRGSLGVNGLTEAEVNLGVALHLRGLLEARGAQVFMTRTDDRDFTTPADSSLRGDLAARMGLANAFRPDLFVSVHHNADAGGLHDKNEIQTYYKLGDQGPSLDAAASIHRYLVRNLGIEKHRIVPGNYYVLRNSEAPGLLTEASYLTNPDVESKLVLASKQRLEAEALFLGIAGYFARPVPVVEEFVAVRGGFAQVRSGVFETIPAHTDTVFGANGDPALVGRVRGVYDWAEIAIDGRPVETTRSGAVVSTGAQALAPGMHRATLRVGLSGSGSSRETSTSFRVARPPARLTAVPIPAIAAVRFGTIAVRVGVEDAAGFPAGDSIAVRLTSECKCVGPADTTVIVRNGVGWGYFHTVAAGMKGMSDLDLLQITARSRDRRLGLAAAAATPTIDARPATRGPATIGVLLEGVPPDSVGAVAPAWRSGEMLRDGRVDAAQWINRDGFAVFPLDAAGRAIAPSLHGFRPWALNESMPPPAVPVRWAAIAGGALHGRRITIDPDGGGDDPAGTGRDGTRAANLNLDVARALAAMLQAAGAETRLTRDGDFALSDVERVEISEAFHADRFLRIGHRAQPPRAGYYFSSAGGKRWAESTVGMLAQLGLPKPATSEDAQYPLQQTSCPALYIAPARIDDTASETRLLAPGTVRAEAYALFLALAREWAPAGWPLDSLTVRDESGTPLAGALVTLGGALVLETDVAGRVRFARTEPGPLEVRVAHPRLNRRVVLLDSLQGVVLTGSQGP